MINERHTMNGKYFGDAIVLTIAVTLISWTSMFRSFSRPSAGGSSWSSGSGSGGGWSGGGGHK